MTTDLPPAEAAQVSFVAALAASDLADACLGPGAARLKWPNDVLVHGRKAAQQTEPHGRGRVQSVAPVDDEAALGQGAAQAFQPPRRESERAPPPGAQRSCRP